MLLEEFGLDAQACITPGARGSVTLEGHERNGSCVHKGAAASIRAERSLAPPPQRAQLMQGTVTGARSPR